MQLLPLVHFVAAVSLVQDVMIPLSTCGNGFPAGSGIGSGSAGSGVDLALRQVVVTPLDDTPQNYSKNLSIHSGFEDAISNLALKFDPGALAIQATWAANESLFSSRAFTVSSADTLAVY